MPKPITINNGYWAAADAPMRPIPGRTLGTAEPFNFPGGGSYYSPFPFFHLAGAQSLLHTPLMALEASAICGLPDRPPTPQLVLHIIKYKKPRALYCPPSILEMTTQMPGGMEVLQTCENIIFAGGPLSKSCGDQLTKVVQLSTVCTCFPCPK